MDDNKNETEISINATQVQVQVPESSQESRTNDQTNLTSGSSEDRGGVDDKSSSSSPNQIPLSRHDQNYGDDSSERASNETGGQTMNTNKK